MRTKAGQRAERLTEAEGRTNVEVRTNAKECNIKHLRTVPSLGLSAVDAWAPRSTATSAVRRAVLPAVNPPVRLSVRPVVGPKVRPIVRRDAALVAIFSSSPRQFHGNHGKLKRNIATGELTLNLFHFIGKKIEKRFSIFLVQG